MPSANPDMTIRDVRVTMLRVLGGRSLAQGPCAGRETQRNMPDLQRSASSIVCSVPAWRSLSEECIIPRVEGKDATAIEPCGAILDRDHNLRPRRHRRDGDVGARYRAVGCGAENAQACRCGCEESLRIPILLGCAAPAATHDRKGAVATSRRARAIEVQSPSPPRPPRVSTMCRARQHRHHDQRARRGWSADVAIRWAHNSKNTTYWLEEPYGRRVSPAVHRIAALDHAAVVAGRLTAGSAAVLPQSVPADPAARPDARRHDRPAQDRDIGRYLRHRPSAPHLFSRVERAFAGLDPEDASGAKIAANF